MFEKITDEIVFSMPNGGFLLIEPEVIVVLKKYRQKESNDVEQGGILIGEYRGKHIRISSVTEPSNYDDATRFSFFRKAKSHFKVAIKSWLLSSKTSTYLGEWHTHPEHIPNPSSIDLNSWKSNLPNRPMVLVIIGITENWWGIHENYKTKKLT